MEAPENIQSIGNELAIRWPDGTEHYLPHDYLRANSPSAEEQGEVDVLGNRHGGTGGRAYPGVSITGWQPTGNYGIAIHFSDGHRTGIYSWDYLRHLGVNAPPTA